MEDEELIIPKPLYLGVLGTHEGATKEHITTMMLGILECLTRMPDRLLLPTEGRNNMFLHTWADRHGIPVESYQADWIHHQRRALIFRDTRIIKEATHLIIFLNKRSSTNEKTALRLARKGVSVFTVDYTDWSITELVVQPEVKQPEVKQPEVKQPEIKEMSALSELSAPRAGSGRKRGTGTKPLSQPVQTSEDHGGQYLLTHLWATSQQKESLSCQSETVRPALRTPRK